MKRKKKGAKMFEDIFQSITFGTIVEAHGKKWTTIHSLKTRLNDTLRLSEVKTLGTYYLAIECDAPLPATPQVIYVEEKL